MCEALTFLTDNIHIRFKFKLYRQIVGIPLGTKCAPLVAYLFCSVMRETSCCLFERIINLKLLKLLIVLPRYLDDLLNINNMVKHIYPSKLQ